MNADLSVWGNVVTCSHKDQLVNPAKYTKLVSKN